MIASLFEVVAFKGSGPSWSPVLDSTSWDCSGISGFVRSWKEYLKKLVQTFLPLEGFKKEGPLNLMIIRLLIKYSIYPKTGWNRMFFGLYPAFRLIKIVVVIRILLELFGNREQVCLEVIIVLFIEHVFQ